MTGRTANFVKRPIVWFGCLGAVAVIATLLLANPLALPLLVGTPVALIALFAVLRFPFESMLALLIAWPLLTWVVRIDLPAGVPDVTIERVGLAAIAASALLGIPATRRLAALNPWLGAYVLALLMSLIYWSALGVALIGTLLPPAVYWLVRTMAFSPKRLHSVLVAFTVAAVLVSWTGFYERLLDFDYSPFGVATGTAAGTRYLDVPGGRAAGVMGNPAVYGAIAASGLLTGLVVWLHARPGRRRFLAGIAVVNLSYAVYVSYTRSAWLAAAASGLVTLAVSKDLRKPTKLLAVLVVAALSVTAAFSSDLPSAPTEAVERFQNTGTIEGRLTRALVSLEAVAESPIIGQGPGALDSIIRDTYPLVGGFTSSHNTYLTVLVDSGILVFIPFVGLLVSWVLIGARTARNTASGGFPRNVLGAALGILTIYVVSAMLLDLRYFEYATAVVFIAGALIESVASLAAAAPQPT